MNSSAVTMYIRKNCSSLPNIWKDLVMCYDVSFNVLAFYLLSAYLPLKIVLLYVNAEEIFIETKS